MAMAARGCDLLQPTQRRHLHRRHRHNHQRRKATEHHGRHRTDQPGRRPRLEGTDLVRASDEDRIDRGDPPQQVIRRQHLQQGRADHHADGIRHATGGQQRDREQKIPRQTKADHAESKDRHAHEQGAPGATKRRKVGQHHRHQHRSHGRCGTQHAKSLGTNVQDLGGKHRQQSHRSPEQHRKEIQREGAKNNRLTSHEADAGGQALQQRTRWKRGPNLGASGAWQPATRHWPP